MSNKRSPDSDCRNLSQVDYRVKEHPRAKHVHLKLSWQGDLEIVVPRGYDRRKIPSVIAEKRAWLTRARQHLHRVHEALPPDHFEAVPKTITLRALGERYRVRYAQAESQRIRVLARDSELLVAGAIDDGPACGSALRSWLHKKARQSLVPWLRQTSFALELPYEKAVVRRQKTRWGSCSAGAVISLNCKLLFTPPEQVHYLFVHELCHTRYLNHSRRYWALVKRHLPNYAELDAALKDAWRYVPAWVEDR